jgi:hypothetical protein
MMAEVRIFVIRLNVVGETTDEQLIKSLNAKGIEVVGGLSTDKFNTVLPLLDKPGSDF